MKLKWQPFRLVLVALPALLGAGCSGINASHSISPATFLIPGLFGKAEVADPSLTHPNQNPTPENHASVPIVAQAQ